MSKFREGEVVVCIFTNKMPQDSQNFMIKDGMVIGDIYIVKSVDDKHDPPTLTLYKKNWTHLQSNFVSVKSINLTAVDEKLAKISTLGRKRRKYLKMTKNDPKSNNSRVEDI